MWAWMVRASPASKWRQTCASTSRSQWHARQRGRIDLQPARRQQWPLRRHSRECRSHVTGRSDKRQLQRRSRHMLDAGCVMPARPSRRMPHCRYRRIQQLRNQLRHSHRATAASSAHRRQQRRWQFRRWRLDESCYVARTHAFVRGTTTAHPVRESQRVSPSTHCLREIE